MSMVSSSSHFPTNAEECGGPQSLTPEREAEIREWLDELGARKDFPSVGPYTSLLDSLAEIDRLRSVIASATTQLREMQALEPDHVKAATLFEIEMRLRHAAGTQGEVTA